MTIEDRLSKLEAENRWLKRGGALLVAALAAVVLVAGKDSKVLEAQKLVIRAPDGAVATLTGGELSLRHANQKSAARLAVDEQGLFMNGLDASENPRLGVFAKDDTSELWLFSGDQHRAIQLSASNQGTVAKFHGLNPNHMRVMMGTMGDEHTPQLSFFGKDGETRLSMGVLADERGRVLFYDDKGKRTLVLPR